jgi:hypothetical protein
MFMVCVNENILMLRESCDVVPVAPAHGNQMNGYGPPPFFEVFIPLFFRGFHESFLVHILYYPESKDHLETR